MEDMLDLEYEKKKRMKLNFIHNPT
jgi:hypothetical protein